MTRLTFQGKFDVSSGNSVIDSVFDSGYEPLSGFNDSYGSVFGDPPTNTNDKVVLNIVRFTSPIGSMFACASKKGLCLLDFEGSNSL